MCSINGFINLKQKQNGEMVIVNEIINHGEKRGKDSFGIYVKTNKNEFISKWIDKPTNVSFTNKKFEFADGEFPLLVLNNNRAEPTTEFIENKTVNDTQPFCSKNYVVVHNGIIANDKELKQKYNFITETNIDSEVLPHLFETCNSDDEIADKLINEVKGSFALAFYNRETNKIYFATNYKPLFTMYSNGSLYFSSMPEYLNPNYKSSLLEKIPVEIKPYSMFSICLNEGIESIRFYDLYPKSKNEKKKALIIASSGLDSTVAASWAKNKGYEISLLHFHYDAIAQEKENTHIKLIADYLGVPLYFIPIDFYKDVIGGSNLYKGGLINKNKSGESGTELAFEWVPARNLVFFSIATAFAEAHNMDYIILGGNLEESGAYPDNEEIFQKKFNDLLPNAVGYNKKIEVLTPLATLMKKEIVELGFEVNAPLHLTWSCYGDGEYHCGECGPCFMRKTAFKMAEQNEVIKYLK